MLAHSTAWCKFAVVHLSSFLSIDNSRRQVAVMPVRCGYDLLTVYNRDRVLVHR